LRGKKKEKYEKKKETMLVFYALRALGFSGQARTLLPRKLASLKQCSVK